MYRRKTMCATVTFYIYLILFTYNNLKETEVSIVKSLWKRNLPFVVTFWHGRLLVASNCWSTSQVINVLISGHRDGQCISSAIKKFQIQTITGSSSNGGGSALRIMFRILKKNMESVGITPDGPKGPRARATNGLINLVMLSSVPVIPLSCSLEPNIIVGSWDFFLIGWPFGRSIFMWGKPVIIPRRVKSNVLEIYRQRIEKALNATTAEVDHQIYSISKYF